MSTTFYRGPLTTILLTALASLNKPVGDGTIPPAGGWTVHPDGADSTFTPYVVLATVTASRSSGPIAQSQADWQIPYLLSSTGASRDQCEWMADHARGAVSSLAHNTYTLGPNRYKVQQIYVSSIGGINRFDISNPPFWFSQDGFSVWLARAD